MTEAPDFSKGLGTKQLREVKGNIAAIAPQLLLARVTRGQQRATHDTRFCVSNSFVRKLPAMNQRSDMPAILIPADPTKPVKVVNLLIGGDTLRNLQLLVGGYVEVQAHAEADLWLNEEGRLTDLPINVRANHFLLNDSERAKEGIVGEGSVMYGDAVVTGRADDEGEITPVNPQLIEYFSALKLSPDAMKDWDVRSVEVQVTEWPDGWGL